MKHFTLFLSCVLSLRAAFAPDSIAGKIYRESSAPTGASGASERTVHFLTEERYAYVSSAAVSFITDSAANGKVVLKQPPSDGRYLYRKTGDASATIEYFPDNAPPPLPTNLTFTGPNYGGDNAQPPRFSFSLSDSAAGNLAPAVNISMRGRVSEGRPLIVGFVIPGAPVQLDTFVPPAGSVQREILIRVVGGSSLRQFGVADAWVDTDFELFIGGTSARYTEYKYSDWNKITYPVGGFSVDPSPGATAGLKRVFSFVGAFALTDDSKDAVGFFRLGPGAYTIVAGPKTGDVGGEVLVEVYFLP